MSSPICVSKRVRKIRERGVDIFRLLEQSGQSTVSMFTYSDTHARGLAKFDRVMEGLMLVEGRDDAADWGQRLIAAALQDPKGEASDGAIATIRSFTASDAA